MTDWWKFAGLILAIIVIWYFWGEYSNRSQARQLIEESNGIFDESARIALEKLSNLKKPKSEDHFNAGRIIDLNMHEGKINNTHDLHHAVSRYYQVIKQPSEKLDWFEIDQIENFERRHDALLAEDLFYNDFVQAVKNAKQAKVASEVERAKGVDTKTEAWETFVENNVTHRNDTQNVHDSAVNEQLRSSLKKLQTLGTNQNIPKTTVFHEVSQALDTLDDSKRTKAQKSFEVVKKGASNSTLGIKEDDLLSLVWDRIYAKENAANAENLKASIIESFVDMTSGDGSVVCSSGRCARLIESLAVIDNGNAVEGAMTLQELRNEALKDVQTLLSEHIESTLNSKDTALADVAKSYRDPSIKTLVPAEETFKKHLTSKVSQHMEKNYKSRLSDRDYASLMEHISTAIESI